MLMKKYGRIGTKSFLKFIYRRLFSNIVFRMRWIGDKYFFKNILLSMHN